MTEIPSLDVRTVDKPRVPPGQSKTVKWPVLHYGHVPDVDLAKWRFQVTGLVESPLMLTWAEFQALPRQRTVCDIHCVTRWSRLDNTFEGVPVQEILRRVRPTAEATHVMVHAAPDYTTNLALEDLDRPENLFADLHDGEPLTAEHGGPLRLLVPHLYFWKSAKWVTGLEFRRSDAPGFWEQNGYHMHGDPWLQERYRKFDAKQSWFNTFRNESNK